MSAYIARVRPQDFTFRPASDKQFAFLKKLLHDKAMENDQREAIVFDMEQGLSSKGASQWIDIMLRFPRATAPVLDLDVTPRAHVSEPGFYKTDEGDVFKVVTSQFGRLYAKQTTARGLVYVEGAMKLLFADQKMTGEEIAAHGVANRYCVVCSTEFEDPTSKHIGIGPTCGVNQLGKDRYKALRASVAHFEDVIAFEAAKKAEAKAKREAKKLVDAQGVFEIAV